jgi:hypothetical protein
VWDRLPSEPAGVQDQIIHCAYYSVTLFSAIIPMPLEHSWPPKKDDLKKWSEIVHERPRGTSFDYTAGLALQLAQSMTELRSECAFYWQKLWSGDPSVSVEQSIELVCSLGIFFHRVQEEHKNFIATLPKIARPYSRKSQEVFFTNMMSSCLNRLYGRKLDRVVTALVEVAFDKREGADQETIRARRREAIRRNRIRN